MDDLKTACIVSLCIGKSERRAYGNYRGISMLSIVGKIYVRVLVSKVIENTKEKVEE